MTIPKINAAIGSHPDNNIDAIPDSTWFRAVVKQT